MSKVSSRKFNTLECVKVNSISSSSSSTFLKQQQRSTCNIVRHGAAAAAAANSADSRSSIRVYVYE